MRDFESINIEEQLTKIRGRLPKDANKGNFNELKEHLELNGYDEAIYPFEEMLYDTAKFSKGRIQFREGIGVQQIINLFKMSQEISHEVLRSILDVERAIKTTLKHNIAEVIEKKGTKLKIMNVKDGKGQTIFSKYASGETVMNRTVEIEFGGKKMGLKTKNRISKEEQITYFDIVNTLSFNELIYIMRLYWEFNHFGEMVYKTLKVPTNVKKEKFIATLKYISRIRNLLAHNEKIIGKGMAKTYVNSSMLYYYQSMKTKRMMNNYYPLKDFLFFYFSFSKKSHGELVSKISQIYYKYAFSFDKPIFSQEMIFGYELFVFKK